MSEMTYSRGSLMLDYVRALLGLGIVGGLLAFTTPVVWVQWILLALFVLFTAFTLRTWNRHKSVFALHPQGLEQLRPRAEQLGWDELQDVQLRYFSTRRDRKNGWMQLNLQGNGKKIIVDSNLSGFDAILQTVAGVVTEKKLDLGAATRENFRAMGLLE